MQTRDMAAWQVVARAQGALDIGAAIEFVSDPGFGGIALFAGRVRDLNLGRQVSGISYDLHQALVMRGFEQQIAQVQAEFGPRLKLYVAHASGRLQVGDLAMLVAAGTPHRDAAFRACRRLVEAVKHRSPIWKQEHYLDGSSEWSEGCSLCEAPHAADAAADPAAHDHGRACSSA
ncbi:molybdenum cofactor biosynthesis protein MoaE [Stenotrophomonas sp. YIM B06876]|uniref:molybdenum cofactor biosynthesis protein MoaE n=1 Tax=Stenotrophomonas sp. YIM B06876 TaxID=3060211 RepID=UPI00273942B8|nr:molybdenum cofactor biosynthesis protein MoaE [Stenotrophomonas sp. YIM B06876]